MPPISDARSRAKQPIGCLVAFFGIFLVVGCAVSYFVLWRPMSRFVAAQSWQPVPCTIESSQVEESSDSDGSTYKVAVTFAYTGSDGREYRSSRYDFMAVSSSGYDGKAAVVARYPVGMRTTCWADPENPSEAVLSRDFSLTYLLGLFPLIFVAVGGGGIIWVLRQGRKKAATAGPGASRSTLFGVDIPADAAQPRVLKPTMSPVGKLLGIIFLALFWNGIVSVFVVLAYKEWRSGGHVDGCLVLFLVPFVFVGLALIWGVFHQFLVLFNPRLELALSQGVLIPGRSANLQWQIHGRSGRVRRLRVVLEGAEQVTYRQGTDTKTDTDVFATIPVIDTDQQMLIAQGTARVEVPEGTMPSFSADHNKVVWTLKTFCEIPGWPDSNEEYEIVVAPGL
jgi:hypothetical protein